MLFQLNWEETAKPVNQLLNEIHNQATLGGLAFTESYTINGGVWHFFGNFSLFIEP